MAEAERACRSVGHTAPSSQMWAAIVTVNDNWNEYQQLADVFTLVAE
jgi:hypothetical protein